MENHYITIEKREKITVTEVLDVDAFDEYNLWANLKEGSLEVSGENLNIEKLDLQEGLLVVTGKVYSVSYNDKKAKEKKLLHGIFKRKQK